VMRTQQRLPSFAGNKRHLLTIKLWPHNAGSVGISTFAIGWNWNLELTAAAQTSRLKPALHVQHRSAVIAGGCRERNPTLLAPEIRFVK